MVKHFPNNLGEEKNGNGHSNGHNQTDAVTRQPVVVHTSASNPTTKPVEKTHQGKGLVWESHFAKGDPYAGINWELRTAKIAKGGGEVVFEQRDVEVPSFWSQTATDITASKYFRGRMDAPERERSARQMVDRVANEISRWGWEDGYFASEQDYQNFSNDLKWILINQYASFNSPVWFNVGVREIPQCSACFILSVEDNMQSILDWYHDEGMIFKMGSGSGANLSFLRSSKEALSMGGRSSGPVSFMKGADGVANSIRSGGTTRRAAKMVVLNVDHPDIKSFIYCKKEIEDMVKILQQAGVHSNIEATLFDPYTLLPYQNANNSVRVTDQFMQAVLNDADWELKAVTTGEALEKVKAREVMDWVADATWHSADPGMQYDTTINYWHTLADTSRINASNPCVTGDTLVATDQGLKRIVELIGQQPNVRTLDGYHQAKKVWQTGVKPVYELTTQAGYSLKVTENHLVYTSNRGDVRAKDLIAGDQLVLDGSGFGAETLPLPLALSVGYAVGDGCVANQVQGNPMLTWVGGKSDTLVLEQIAAAVNQYSAGVNKFGNIGAVHVHNATTGLKVATSRPDFVMRAMQYAVLDQGSENKKFTEAIFSLDKNSLATMLRGLFMADGTVSGNKAKGFYVGLDSTSLELVKQVQLLLLNFGIKSKLYKNRRTKLTSYLPDSDRNPKLYTVKQMHSLRITRSGRVLFEKEIGFVSGTAKAQKLNLINRECGYYADRVTDEFTSLTACGIEPVYDLTEPISHHFTANGIVVHNCSEYMSLDNSACNLASINLMKYLRADGYFDVQLYKKTIDLFILAQDILVDRSSYPTEKIDRNAHDYRQLGLGYANLGALLMTMGLPYDSDAGRAWGGLLTSILTGEAYRMSAVLAEAGGPFRGYAANQHSMLDVIHKHATKADELVATINSQNLVNNETLKSEAVSVWQEALMLGQHVGYRNSQATVLAPTGTISFLMDCATTGVEPALALVAYKKLVGGGTLKLVNSQVESALKNLGYSDQEIDKISEYILAEETIEGAPGFRPEHLPVFDCSFKATKGERSISYLGHLRMMAATQPFISGAISKTVNLPSDATKEDIREAFIAAWRYGLKAVAFYRDGSKTVQPLNVSNKTENKLVEQYNGHARFKLPDERASLTHKFSVGGHEGYLTVSFYPETKKVGETFIRIAKEGSTVSGLLDVIATLTSIALQSGVPLKVLVRKFKDMRFDPSGFTANPDVPIAKSIIDYVFRYMGMRFLEEKDREEIFGTMISPENLTNGGIPAATQPNVAPVASGEVSTDGAVCECGSLMFKAGSCYTCPNCFATTGVCN